MTVSEVRCSRSSRGRERYPGHRFTARASAMLLAGGSGRTGAAWAAFPTSTTSTTAMSVTGSTSGRCMRACSGSGSGVDPDPVLFGHFRAGPAPPGLREPCDASSRVATPFMTAGRFGSDPDQPQATIRCCAFLIFVHRWVVGVALCLLFLLWFPSGIGMMYWGFSQRDRGPSRLARAPVLDAGQVTLTPRGRCPDTPARPPAPGSGFV